MHLPFTVCANHNASAIDPIFFFECSRYHQDLHSFPTRRSSDLAAGAGVLALVAARLLPLAAGPVDVVGATVHERSEEHTSELQSHSDLVCRLLLEKKKTRIMISDSIARWNSSIILAILRFLLQS